MIAFLISIAASFWGEPPASAETFTFAVMGDLPYEEDEFPLMRRQVAELDESIPFVLHVGDIKRSTVPFREADYARVADELKRSKIPVFITPGDNEYNDARDPKVAWTYWQKYFGELHNHWPHKLEVRYQEGRRENVAFVHGEILFVMINLVGGRLHDRNEWIERMADDATWIKSAFAELGASVRGAVIVAHAHAIGPRQSFAVEFVPAAAKFAKPILYIHGDGHRWIHNRPFAAAPNVERVQIDQGGIAPPLRVVVADSSAADGLFTFQRNLTPEYDARRKAYDEISRADRAKRAAAAPPTKVENSGRQQ